MNHSTSSAAIFRNPTGIRAGTGPYTDELAQADRCVHCGMCLPQCPTYGVHRVEGDSPRGRITLMQGLAQGRLKPGDPQLRAHIEGCLGCRSCETICPAKVPFGTLIDVTRRILADEAAPTARLVERLFGPLRAVALRQRPVRLVAGLAARAARGLGLRYLLPESVRLGRVLRHTAPALVASPGLQPVAAVAPADVQLFTGCMEAFFTGPDAAAAIELLQAMGLRVSLPARQVCCGAIDQHLGRPAGAATLLRKNAAAFGRGDEPVVVLDSGCEAQLREHAGSEWRERVTSLTGFLARLGVERFRWRHDPVRIALHLPCTLRNVTLESTAIQSLFRRLPGVEVAALVPPGNCCGAAGTAMFTQPIMADILGGETLAGLRSAGPDVIVSPNVGCTVHLLALHGGDPEMPPILSPARFLRDRLAPPEAAAT